MPSELPEPRLTVLEQGFLAYARVADSFSAASIACVLDGADLDMHGVDGDYDEDDAPPLRRWEPRLLARRVRAHLVSEGL